MGHLARVCRSRQLQQPTPQATIRPSSKALSVPTTDKHAPQINVSKLGHSELIKSAPTVWVHISLNSEAEIEILPDSGTDLSVAGETALNHLGEHRDNLLPSTVIPHTVNGARMQPVGNQPVTFTLGLTTHTDTHIYPDFTGMLLAWKAAKGLHIFRNAIRIPPPWVHFRYSNIRNTHLYQEIMRIPIRVWRTDQNHGRWAIPHISDR